MTSTTIGNSMNQATASTCRNDLLLRALRREKTPRPPVWLMRQAGRFDPDYHAVKAEANLELEELFSHPEYAAKITLLPKRLGVDALIIFQDILTPLTPMGAPFVFRPGPVLEKPIRSRTDIADLKIFDPSVALDFFSKAIRLTLAEVDHELPLLGFAGAPFTLAAFAIEGKSPGRELNHTRALMQSDPAALHDLLAKLADMTAEYLKFQIAAGVHAVQLFESVADLLSPAEYQAFAHPYHQRVINQLNADAPVILFIKEQPFLELMVETGANAISIGRCNDLGLAQRAYGSKVAIQGNVDNEILRGGTLDEITAATHACIQAGNCNGHILNLNHGIFRDTPFENVVHFINTCRNWVSNEESAENLASSPHSKM